MVAYLMNFLLLLPVANPLFDFTSWVPMLTKKNLLETAVMKSIEGKKNHSIKAQPKW